MFSLSVSLTFSSKGNYVSKEFQSTGYQLEKLIFLMTKIQSYFEQVLKPLNTNVVLRSNTPCLTVEFISEYHEFDFPDWVESCLNCTEHCVRHLELLLIKGAVSEINHTGIAAVLSQLGHNSVWVFTIKDIDGVFLLGSVDSIIYLIPELHKHFQNISFWNMETGEEVKQTVFQMNPMSCRLNAIFKGTEKLVTSYPYLTIRYMGSETGLAIWMLGNHNDITEGVDFLNSLAWLGGAPWRYCLGLEGFEFFLAREHVQSFIDGMITTQDGTWVIDNHSKIVVFGKTEEDVNSIMNTLNGSIRKMEFFVADTHAFSENANEWITQAKELEKTYGGKCHFSINAVKNSSLLGITFMFTVDLENEHSLKMLIHNVELQSFNKLSLQRSEKQLKWIQLFYSGDLITEAQRAGVNFNILRDTNVIEIEGIFTAVKEMAGLIDTISMEERHILLPLKVLQLQPADFFSGYRCCFENTKSENCRFWIRGKIGIVASCCQSGFEHMYAHLKAKLVNGEHRGTSVSSKILVFLFSGIIYKTFINFSYLLFFC